MQNQFNILHRHALVVGKLLTENGYRASDVDSVFDEIVAESALKCKSILDTRQKRSMEVLHLSTDSLELSKFVFGVSRSQWDQVNVFDSKSLAKSAVKDLSSLTTMGLPGTVLEEVELLYAEMLQMSWTLLLNQDQDQLTARSIQLER